MCCLLTGVEHINIRHMNYFVFAYHGIKSCAVHSAPVIRFTDSWLLYYLCVFLTFAIATAHLMRALKLLFPRSLFAVCHLFTNSRN